MDACGAVALSAGGGGIVLPGDIWQHLETVLAVAAGGELLLASSG